MEFRTLIVDEHDGIFIITLNRPESRNALNSLMWKELCDAFEYLDGNSSLRVCIMTNAGSCFCAGSDLKELDAGTYHAPSGREEWGFGGMTRHYVSKPIIIAVNGKALGGGAEMLLAADLAVISSDGIIGYPEVARALLAAGGGGLLRIGRSIPVKRAMELMLTGDPIDAQTALEWGLVNRIADPGNVLETALALARAIMKNGPLAIEWTKRAVYDCMDKPWLAQNEAWRHMVELDQRIKTTEDAREGERSFAEKRPPTWKNA